jgi:hypothetical protein
MSWQLTNYTRNPTQTAKQDVDEEVAAASCLEEDRKKREEDGD